MKKKTYAKSIMVILPVLAFIAAGGIQYASADSVSETERGVLKKDRSHLEAIHEAFFKNLTEEQKEVLIKARGLQKAGDKEGAQALLEENNISFPVGFMRDHTGKKGGMRGLHSEAVRTAIENDDYNAFVTATVDAPFSGKIDTAAFASFVEAYNLRKAGDFKGAHEVMKSVMDALKHK